MGTDSGAGGRDGGRRYADQVAPEILKRATEARGAHLAKRRSDDGLTLEQIKSIGDEVGEGRRAGVAVFLVWIYPYWKYLTGAPMTAAASLQKHLPLKPTVLAMLTELAEAPLHGYAIMTRLEYLRGGRGIGPASLYRTLDQLERGGLIGALPPDPGESRRGPAYRLTEVGRRVLEAEVGRIEVLAGRARAALGADR